jgi:hypothetical protein
MTRFFLAGLTSLLKCGRATDLPRKLVPAIRTASFVLIFLLLDCGCATKSAVDNIYDARRKTLVASYASATERELRVEGSTEEGRNRILNNLILLVDMNYHTVEKHLYGEKSWADFGGSVAVIGVSTAGTLAGGESVKTTLAAIAGALEGTRVAFDRDVLQNQNILAIIAKMRAQRAEKLLILRGGMQKSVAAYPLEEGLVDLANYHNAGTIVGALQDIIDKAGAQKAKADTVLNQDIKKLHDLKEGLGD